ncbi:mechanosensitive ion channel family protein [bacterium]|nr:mechanosensitive ion channel family protein [bacterium]
MLDVAAVPFLTLIALGILALVVSVFLRAVVDRQISLARREHNQLEAEGAERIPEPFWLRYGEAIKRSIQSLAWTLVGLGVLNMVSYGLVEIAGRFAHHRDGSFTERMSDDLQRLSFWIKQGADILLRIVVVAVAGVWVARFFHGAMRGLLNGGIAARHHADNPRLKARSETLLTTSSYVINVGVFTVCLLMSLQMLGVSVAPLLATAGVASVAIGFGAQSLVRDVVAGFFILLEDQFAVGDVISIEGRTGSVENLTLRSTKIRLPDGALLIIPNGEIKRIENSTSGFSQVDFRVSVLYGRQVDTARSIVAAQLARIARDFSHDVLAQPEFMGVELIKNSTVVLRGKVTTRPGQQWFIERELNKRILDEFLVADIQLPNSV